MFTKYLIVLLVIVFAVVQIYGASRYSKRALPRASTSNDTTETPPKEMCLRKRPCGFAVYSPITRYIEYFMHNNCICPEGKKCSRDHDDISITAYVYICKTEEKKTGKS